MKYPWSASNRPVDDFNTASNEEKDQGLPSVLPTNQVPQPDIAVRINTANESPHASSAHLCWSNVQRDRTFMTEIQTGTMINEERKVEHHAAHSIGSSLDDLIDRLLAQPMSKTDIKFAAIFLCLYRKFAAPAELLSGTLRRFELLNEDGEASLSRIASQLRYLGILAQWVAEYPGDFAHPLTYKQITNFIAQISNNQVFAAAAREMGAQLDDVCDNDDTMWACSDISRGRAKTLDSYLSVPSMRNFVDCMVVGSFSGEIDKHEKSTNRDEFTIGRSVGHPESLLATSSGADRSTSASATSLLMLLNSFEAAQRQAELLKPISRNALTKVQWHQFMSISEEDIARELTRIDRIMYCSVRTRDLIRHVSLPAHEKGKCKGLKHVDRMIHHFNYVAFWVANIVLLRDKAKHRAKALERFMGIAWVRLRCRYSYLSLRYPETSPIE